VIVDRPRPGVVRLTLNRPDVLNAIDWQTLAELEAEVEKAAADPTARALVVTGAGDRAFCSGADLNIVRDLDGEAIREWAVAGHRAFGRLAAGRLPSIAAIHGYCLGGGLELALSCDLRMAAVDAAFGSPELQHGWIPGWGGIPMLSRTVGEGRARDIIMTGERVGADDAWRIGLCREPVPGRELEAASLDLAERVGALRPVALRALREALPGGPPEPGSAGSEFEIRALQEQLAAAREASG
jgi:enoyl-CoA hydratase